MRLSDGLGGVVAVTTWNPKLPQAKLAQGEINATAACNVVHTPSQSQAHMSVAEYGFALAGRAL